MAACWTSSINFIFVSISIGISLSPDCLVPSISQAPRLSKSISANLNPSLVFSSALSLL